MLCSHRSTLVEIFYSNKNRWKEYWFDLFIILIHPKYFFLSGRDYIRLIFHYRIISKQYSKSEIFGSSKDKNFSTIKLRSYIVNVLSNRFHGTFDPSNKFENLTHDFSLLIFRPTHNRFIIRPNFGIHSLDSTMGGPPPIIRALFLDGKRTETWTLAGYPGERSSRWPILGNVPTWWPKLRCLVKSRLGSPCVHANFEYLVRVVSYTTANNS